MVDFSGFQIGLGSQSYPMVYNAFVAALQPYATELEDARQGQASLTANLSRYVNGVAGLGANLAANGLRITGLGMPGAGGDAVNKTYADGLSFAAALPAQAGNAGLTTRTDGVITTWDNWWGPHFALTSASALVDHRAYHADSTGGAFTVTLPPQSSKSCILIRDVGRVCAQNPITITPNGTDKVYGSVQDYIMDKNGETLMLVVDATKGWVRA